MSFFPETSGSERQANWPSAKTNSEPSRKPCLTELSGLGLMGGAVGLSVALWIAIFTVL